MSTELKIYKGNEINLPSSLEEGSVYVCVDTGKVCIDLEGKRVVLTQLEKTVESGYKISAAELALKDSIAFGVNCKGGSWAYRIIGYQLYEDGSGYYELNCVDGLEIGQIYSAKPQFKSSTGELGSMNIGSAGTITNIDPVTNTVYVDKMITRASADGELWDWTEEVSPDSIEKDEANNFRIQGLPFDAYNKEYAFQIGGNSISFGNNCQTLSMGAIACGGNNIVGGSWSSAFGIDNEISSYCSFIAGDKNIISGLRCTAFGRVNKAAGDLNFVAGHQNVVDGKYNFVTGDRNKCLDGDTSMIGGVSNTNTGLRSFIYGVLNENKGSNITIFGQQNIFKIVNGKYSFIGGIGNEVGGTLSFTYGEDNYNSCDNAIIFGESNQAGARASYSFIAGQSNYVLGTHSMACGSSNYSNPDKAYILGNSNNITGTGIGCVAIGVGNSVKNIGNIAIGKGLLSTRASGSGLVVGKYNKETSDFFVIGCGTGEAARKNLLTLAATGAFKINNNNDATIFDLDAKGNTTIPGAYKTNPSDYAEYFEWEDSNLQKENRTGRFVVLSNNKIKLANAGEDVIGIVSGTPGVISNTYEFEWQGRYLKDEFGATIYEEYINEDGEVNTRPVENPEYDPEMKYIPRSQRPEWAPVGFMGQIIMLHDGTCEVNGYCAPGVNGIATSSSEKTNCQVMKVIDETHILVLLK